MSSVLKLRPVDPDDEPFLRSLRAQLDSERLGLQWLEQGSDELVKSILDLQFHAHNQHYAKVKSGWETRDNIIELDDRPIGRFIVTGDKHEIHLCDIVIDRQYRGRGIGINIIQNIKSECQQSNRPLRLHAEKNSPILQFYIKQEFRIIEERDSHYYMEWIPNPERQPIYSFAN